jgi:hypothetical protein
MNSMVVGHISNGNKFALKLAAGSGGGAIAWQRHPIWIVENHTF